MQRSPRNVRAFAANLAGLLASVTLLAAAGCGEVDDDAESDESAITGGWETLNLLNGWGNYNGTNNVPAIGRVNGVLTLRGALNGAAATDSHAFTLPAGKRPLVGEFLYLRIVTANNTGGTLFIDPDHKARIIGDGVAFPGPGANAKIFTSLDGVSVDDTATNATPLVYDGTTDNNWVHLYGHRHQGNEPWAVSAKMVAGFVRFQGFLKKADGGNPSSMFLFQIPSASGFRPGQNVYVPVVLCGGGGANQTYGRLNILSSGNVYVQPENGNTAAANCGVSFEGASYALSSATQTLNLQNGWAPYSARPVRVRNSGGVIRFQGALAGGTANTIANMLPTSMRPPTTVYLQADSWNAARARIVVQSNGTVFFDTPSLSVAQGFLSLDGVSFGL
jgi:hypothetical protein